MKGGLMTLADIGQIGSERNPRSQITVARLGKYQDARYGKFEIGEADFEGWTHNLQTTFGGRVSVDFDHSSDRGRGTEAAGWIVGLERQGQDLVASVEWTPKGAAAIRDKSYLYISPTYTNHYKDQYGVDRGRSLIGAAATNRPVLRQLPTLSLSRDRFDGVATPRQPKKKDRPMSKQPKTRVMVLDGGQLKSKELDAQELATEVARILARHRRDTPRTLAGAGSVDTVMTLAAYAPAGVAHAGTLNWDAPQTGASREPRGLDDSGRALHALVVNHAQRTGEPYFHALAHVTGVPHYRDLSDVPTTPAQQQGLDPERAALDASARGLAASAGIGWFDAAEYLEQLAEHTRLQADDGSAAVPFLDSRPLSTPPRPWSDEDWARDSRRAQAAGLTVSKELWKGSAEAGRDVVGEEADKARANAITGHKAMTEGFLDQARAREDNRRSSAINDELIRRARNRVAARR